MLQRGRPKQKEEIDTKNRDKESGEGDAELLLALLVQAGSPQRPISFEEEIELRADQQRQYDRTDKNKSYRQGHRLAMGDSEEGWTV